MSRAAGTTGGSSRLADVEGPGNVVRSFFELMEARDWQRAGQLLSPSLDVAFTETGERFHGAGYLAMNEAYPEGWSIEVVETVADGQRVAAQVRVTHGEQIFWCAGFYTVTAGMITSGIEHWVTERSQPAPEWRRRFVTR